MPKRASSLTFEVPFAKKNKGKENYRIGDEVSLNRELLRRAQNRVHKQEKASEGEVVKHKE